MDREIAGDFVAITAAFHLGALEAKRRELLRVEKIRTLEILITLVVVGVDAIDRHAEFHGILRRIGRIESDGAGDRVEVPVKIRYPEMLRAEDD